MIAIQKKILKDATGLYDGKHLKIEQKKLNQIMNLVENKLLLAALVKGVCLHFKLELKEKIKLIR